MTYLSLRKAVMSFKDEQEHLLSRALDAEAMAGWLTSDNRDILESWAFRLGNSLLGIAKRARRSFRRRSGFPETLEWLNGTAAPRSSRLLRGAWSFTSKVD